MENVPRRPRRRRLTPVLLRLRPRRPLRRRRTPLQPTTPQTHPHRRRLTQTGEASENAGGRDEGRQSGAWTQRHPGRGCASRRRCDIPERPRAEGTQQPGQERSTEIRARAKELQAVLPNHPVSPVSPSLPTRRQVVLSPQQPLGMGRQLLPTSRESDSALLSHRGDSTEKEPLTDLLDSVRRAEATARAERTAKDQKAAYLRSRGWRLNGGKSQRWLSDNGISATLTGAAALHLIQDLQADRCAPPEAQSLSRVARINVEAGCELAKQGGRRRLWICRLSGCIRWSYRSHRLPHVPDRWCMRSVALPGRCCRPSSTAGWGLLRRY
jgi:hypothetical protein